MSLWQVLAEILVEPLPRYPLITTEENMNTNLTPESKEGVKNYDNNRSSPIFRLTNKITNKNRSRRNFCLSYLEHTRKRMT